MNRVRHPIARLLLGNLILMTVVAQANHYLAPWQLHLWLGGLLAAPAALSVRHRAGAVAVFVTGLALDATTPVRFGTQALLLLAGHALAYTGRDRVARGEASTQVMTAFTVNLATFGGLALVEAWGAPHGRGLLGRLVADLVASQLALLLVAPWFCALLGALLSPSGRRDPA